MNELEALIIDFSKLALVAAFLALVSVVLRSIFHGHAGGPPPRPPALANAQPAFLPAPVAGAPSVGAAAPDAGASKAPVSPLGLEGESEAKAKSKAKSKAEAKAEAADEEAALTMADGESLSEFRARLKKSAPPKKSSISAEMLDTANSYDDKVALVRMLVSEDSGRVAVVLKNMIQRDLGK